MLTQDDHPCADAPRGRDDLTRRQAGGPREVGFEPCRGEMVASLGQMVDDIRRRRERVALVVREVVECAVEARSSGLSGISATSTTVMWALDDRASSIARSSARLLLVEPS